MEKAAYDGSFFHQINGGFEMIALNIADVRDFMSKMLVHGTFDKFYLCEASVETFTSFQFGGPLHKDYYSIEEQEALGDREMPLWQEMRPFAYELIRGKKLPISFKFVFALSNENLTWLLEHNHLNINLSDVSGLFLNIRYENKKVTCITGTSFKTFVMDKTLERLWDATAVQFMKQNQIPVEEM